VQIHGHLVILHGVAQEGGVGKAGGLCRNQIAGVLHDDGVFAVENEIVCRLAGGLAAAEEQDLVADFLLLSQQLSEGDGLVEAGDRHGSGHGAGGDDYLVVAADGVGVVDLGVEDDLDAGLVYLALVPLDELLVVLLEGHGGSGDKGAAQLVGLFIDDSIVAALGEHKSALHAADAAADDGDLLGVLGGDYLVSLMLHGGRGQSAAGQMQGVLKVLDIGSALELCKVEAAVVAADAGLDVVLTAFLDLDDPFGVDQVLTCDGDGIQTAGSDFFGSLDGIHTAGAGHGYVHERLDVLDVLQVAVVGHVLRRMCPIPCVVCTVIAVEQIVACILQILDGLLGLGHIAAELHKVLAGDSALAEALGLGNDGITKGHGEVVAGLALDGLDDLHGEAIAVLEGSAVLVGTIVHVGYGELVQQIAFVDCVDLDAVYAGFSEHSCGLAESVDLLLDLLNGHGARLDLVIPAVGGGGSGSAAVLDVANRLCQLGQQRVLEHLDHVAVDGH